jgi:peptide/nickel transport system substrate-binding protein
VRVKTTRTVAVLLSGIALAVTGCSTGTSAPVATPNGQPVKGGTLKLLGSADLDNLDPANAYYLPSYGLLRAVSRQLVSYRSAETVEQASAPAPDMAVALPEPTNGGRTYRFTIKDGVQWDAPSGARQVTGADVARGFKRLCNPSIPSGGLGYYVGVIAGMAEFCQAFEKVPATAPAIGDFIARHEISGIKADGNEVEFTLVKPAGDFLNLLAMPFASAAPIETLQYLPDSPEYRKNFISDGPYTFKSYTADKQIELVRNPAWRGDTDKLRGAHVDAISVVLGVDEGPAQMQLQAGTADLGWDLSVPTAAIPGLKARGDKQLMLTAAGSATYLAINLRSPNAGGALQNLRVRQALNYAVNKKNVIQVLGGPDVYQPIGQILTPSILGHKSIDPFATADSAGDPAKAKQLLAEAGYSQGLELVFAYRGAGKSPQIAATLQADLKKAGITLRMKALAPSDLGRLVSSPAAGARGEWDLAAPSWSPDWQGNSARSFLVPLLDGRTCGDGSPNYGCYDNPTVNSLIDQALAQADPAVAADLWAQADATATADAPWVPVTTGTEVRYRSARVAGWAWNPLSVNADLTNVWLSK